ncbi:MAG: portal protein, partial [Azospirillaceae bacterium]
MTSAFATAAPPGGPVPAGAPPDQEDPLSPARVRARFERARERRRPWEGLWQECYDVALPRRGRFEDDEAAVPRRNEGLFDGTAPDAVDQIASSLLANLTPPWSRWAGFGPGIDVGPADREALAPMLEAMAQALQDHLDRSNFAVEMHQCLLDLVVGGTASLLVEEAPPGEPSALRFTAVPLADAVLEEGPEGKLDVAFRRARLTVEQIRRRFPGAVLPERLARREAAEEGRARETLIEAVVPEPPGRGAAYRYTVLLADAGEEDVPLASRRMALSPFVNFRWIKAPGEVYGRSPVMKALPDIKTANKVVELVLKNASIAVTGIWQADDDGVLNPAAVRLRPGTIIPKAVGSAGLTPLEAPGKFDVSQLVLDDMRARIRHALMVDRLAQVESPRMTATEVMERSAEMARLLGATYGRLQAELLVPLVRRCLEVLRRRGEVPDLPLDGRLVALQHRAPLAQAQAQRDAQGTLTWLQTVLALGPEAAATVDGGATARWLAERFAVPPDLLRAPEAA